MEKDYEYTCTFEGGNTEDFSSIFLRFEGLDTVADVYLNGELLGQPLNMHRVWEYEVQSLLKGRGEYSEGGFSFPTELYCRGL